MPWTLWTMHPSALEIAKKHIDNNDEVHVFFCKGELKGCAANPEYLWDKCKICMIRTKKCLDICGIPLANRHPLKIRDNFVDLTIPEFCDIKELKKFRFEDIGFGMGVASSVIAQYDDTSPEFSTKLKNDIKSKLLIAYAFYNSVKKIISKVNPDVVYIANGRLAYLLPAVQYCQKKNIDFYTFERGELLSKYFVVKGNFWDSNILKKVVTDFWDNSIIPEEEKYKIADQWYDERLSRKNPYSYTKKQTYGSLPDSILDNKRAISIFITSENELEAIEGKENPFFLNQLEGLKYIFDNIDDENIRFYVRVHPHLAGKNNSQTQGLQTLHYNNVEIIGADSPIDSYELVKKSEKVIVFGSTVGVESTYYGTPTILLGKALYEDLNVAYIPSTKEEIPNLINDKCLQPKPKLGSLKYGYFWNFYGEPYQYYKSESLGIIGTFMGEQIGSTPMIKMIQRINWIHGILTRLIVKLYQIFLRAPSFGELK